MPAGNKKKQYDSDFSPVMIGTLEGVRQVTACIGFGDTDPEKAAYVDEVWKRLEREARERRKHFGSRADPS